MTYFLLARVILWMIKKMKCIEFLLSNGLDND